MLRSTMRARALTSACNACNRPCDIKRCRELQIEARDSRDPDAKYGINESTEERMRVTTPPW